MSATGCPFCEIAAGRQSAAVVADDGDTLAFMDLRQAVPGHVLVVPRRHAVDLHALTPDEAADVMRMARRVALALRSELGPSGLSLWQSNGEVAGQEVFHFHLHVHPRREGDGLLRAYPPEAAPQPLAAQELDRLASALRKRLQD